MTKIEIKMTGYRSYVVDSTPSSQYKGKSAKKRTATTSTAVTIGLITPLSIEWTLNSCLLGAPSSIAVDLKHEEKEATHASPHHK
eukprot:220724-Rhodomonas_salina.2